MNIKVDKNGVSSVELNVRERAMLGSALVLCKLLHKHGDQSIAIEQAVEGLSGIIKDLNAPPPAVQQPARELVTVAESESTNGDDSFDDPSDSE